MWGNVQVRGVGVELDGMMVRKLSCKTRDTSHETQTSKRVSQNENEVKIARLGRRLLLSGAGYSGGSGDSAGDRPETPGSLRTACVLGGNPCLGTSNSWEIDQIGVWGRK